MTSSTVNGLITFFVFYFFSSLSLGPFKWYVTFKEGGGSKICHKHFFASWDTLFIMVFGSKKSSLKARLGYIGFFRTCSFHISKHTQLCSTYYLNGPFFIVDRECKSSCMWNKQRYPVTFLWLSLSFIIYYFGSYLIFSSIITHSEISWVESGW